MFLIFLSHRIVEDTVILSGFFNFLTIGCLFMPTLAFGFESIGNILIRWSLDLLTNVQLHRKERKQPLLICSLFSGKAVCYRARQ